MNAHNEINEIEALSSGEVADLIEEQRRQPRQPVACGGMVPVWSADKNHVEELIGGADHGIQIIFDWLSDRAADAYYEMIPESELINYAVPDDDLDFLWDQAGREWHHVKRQGRLIRERFFRRSQIERYGQIYYMA